MAGTLLTEWLHLRFGLVFKHNPLFFILAHYQAGPARRSREGGYGCAWLGRAHVTADYSKYWAFS